MIQMESLCFHRSAYIDGRRRYHPFGRLLPVEVAVFTFLFST